MPNATVRVNDIVSQADIISTGKDSRAILQLANCSALQLSSDTRLEIRRYRIATIPQNIVVTNSPPLLADIHLQLLSGEIIGNVGIGSAGSNFSVGSIMGRAEITGATFRLNITHHATNSTASQSLSVEAGSVSFIPFYPMTGQRPKNSSVNAGEELVAEASFADKTLTKFNSFSKTAIPIQAIELVRGTSKRLGALLPTTLINVTEQAEAKAK